MPNPFQRLRDYYASLRNYVNDHELATPILIALVAIIVGLVLWLLPHYQVRHTPGIAGDKLFDSENEARKTLAQIFGGTVVLLGLYYSGRTFGLSREGHITDRFTKAIEQLGKTDGDKPNIEVRLGAIYALERIAIDSERDHWTIMEVLTAHVRQNAPLDPGRPYTTGEKPRTDIQAILTVLGRRRTNPKRERSDQGLDLTESRLCGANMDKAPLQMACLDRANFRGATMNGTNLRMARLNEANLQSTKLNLASLQEAALYKSNLNDAGLAKADLRGASLIKANLEGAHLNDANLQAGNLYEANLHEAYLSRTDLRNTLWIEIAQIKSAKNWQSAHYSPDFRAKLGLPREPGLPTTLSS